MVRAHGGSLRERPVLRGSMRTEQVNTERVERVLCLPLDPQFEDVGYLRTIPEGSSTNWVASNNRDLLSHCSEG